jgi:hypothetical protein
LDKLTLTTLIYALAGIKKKDRHGHRLAPHLRPGMALMARGRWIPPSERDESGTHVHPRHLRKRG